MKSQRIKNYIPNNSNNTLAESKWLKGASAHDMILQYQLLSLLFTLGKIEGDKIFTRVMQIGIENYLIKMQKNHSLPLTIEQKL